MSSGVAAVWRQHGLSHAGGNALAVIEGSGRALTPGEIGAEMHITSGSITSLVDTLEKRGLVQRDSHEDDRRKVLVSITDDGVDLLDLALPKIQLVVRQQMAGLPEAERTQLLELVGRAYDSVKAAEVDDLPAVRRNRPTGH